VPIFDTTMQYTDFFFTAVCSECNRDLQILHISNDIEDISFSIEPCQTCLENAEADHFAAGQIEGFDRGLQEGITQGFEDGFEQGTDEGRELGYRSAYDDGYSDGYDAAYNDRELLD
jgi:flagellar biosynthesis/type III secretory pathway protein FliH